MNFTGWDVEGWGKAIAAVVATLLAFLGVRRKYSQVGRQNAEDEAGAKKARAEGRIYDDQVDAITKERDYWRDRCERMAQEREEHREVIQREQDVIKGEALKLEARILDLQSLLRHEKSDRRMERRMLKTLHPEIDFDRVISKPGGLDSIPPPEM